ncbi:MAG: hypothetical protein ABL893_09245, partial [Hyphomicrobium sp.]
EHMRIIFNAILMILEVAAIAGIAWLGLNYPLIFAGLTAATALALGVGLEIARLKNELPFYFDRPPGKFALFTAFVGSTEAFVKALLAGVVALLTFLGTDHDRLTIVALCFAACLFIGVQVVRFLADKFQARPLRWGYFRLAPPLGLMFSAGLSFLSSPGITEMAKRAAFDLPERPSLQQASEFLFLLKQSFDDIVERMLGLVFETGVAQGIAAVVSVNMLSGFVLALYAVLIAEGVRFLEQTNT